MALGAVFLEWKPGPAAAADPSRARTETSSPCARNACPKGVRLPDPRARRYDPALRVAALRGSEDTPRSPDRRRQPMRPRA